MLDFWRARLLRNAALDPTLTLTLTSVVVCPVRSYILLVVHLFCDFGTPIHVNSSRLSFIFTTLSRICFQSLHFFYLKNSSFPFFLT